MSVKMRATTTRRIVVVAVLLGALALTACAQPTPGGAAQGAAPASAPGAPEGTAVASGGSQSISVDLTQGFYAPTVIHAKAGVPLTITFGQGQGCLAQVLIPAFGVEEDLTSGGAVVKLPAMKPGDYEFSCGMKMVFGTIAVE